MKTTILYVGSSLLAPLRQAEEEINRRHRTGLRVAAHNFGAPLSENEWREVERDLCESEVVFVIHVTDGENAARLVPLLRRFESKHRAVVVINCMPELMRRTRMGKLRFGGATEERGDEGKADASGKGRGEGRARRLVKSVGSWMGEQARGRRRGVSSRHAQYLKLVERTPSLVPSNTVGFLLMRTNVVSGTRKHYDGLIRAVEREGLAALPVISTFMDNRDACSRFFGDGETGRRGDGETEDRSPRLPVPKSRVSQIVSLTGFSFVGGPAMNDSEAAVEFLRGLKRPLRSAVSLDVQTVEAWRESWTGLNPVQAGMQVAIPEIDGATEPFVFGGMTAEGIEPVALEERCRRVARRLRRWNRLQNAERGEIKIALVLFCFPPNKGNIGTAADLDVFPSVQEILCRLRAEGYAVEVPPDADRLREMLLGGNSAAFGAVANVAYRMGVEEYLRLCPYAADIENEWGAAPGHVNTFGRELLIQGVRLGNVFVAVQPTFGYEGDPMRLLMSRGGAPHHGFAALYTYLEKIFRADAVVHTGTHGALEFMPGKQVGLSGKCWPDRLIGELPHVYIYSVNNPSEGSIARRRSYAGLVSYLTPPIEDAGLYRDLASLKEVLLAYRQSADEGEREQLYAVIEEKAAALHFAGG